MIEYVLTKNRPPKRQGVLHNDLISMLPLLNSFTQDTRLLKLSTPLGRDKLLAECLRAEEGLSQPIEFKLTALSTDAAIKRIWDGEVCERIC